MLHSLIYKSTSLHFLLPAGIVIVIGGILWAWYNYYTYQRDNKIFDEEEGLIWEGNTLNENDIEIPPPDLSQGVNGYKDED